ncbi:MAG: glycosyltransferase family 4 protein [Paludibacteraceae bacterium]|nr:glycosyltransferase family 4 protein [Paludibacteraceae bacterium]
MNHLLFISHARGLHGAEAVMVQAVKACAASGAHVTVVVPSVVPDSGMDKALSGIRGVQMLTLPYRPAGGSMLRTRLVRLYNWRALRELKRFVTREQVTTIYSNTSITILGAELARITHVRHIWHWHEPVDERFGWHFTLKDYYRELAQAADTIVCISRHQQAEWEQTLGIPLSNAVIVYNPIKRLEARSPQPHKDVRIGFIGHFEERKNIPLLLQVFLAIHNQVSETHLSLCGAIDEHDRECIEQMTDLREPVLTILPQTPDVTKFYHSIDILVLPSWRETMPLVVLEAMQAGVCVLQTNKSGMSELLEAGIETLFFSPDRPEELEHLLLQCLDADYRRLIAQAGQQKALQLVNNQSFNEQITKLLCE